MGLTLCVAKDFSVILISPVYPPTVMVVVGTLVVHLPV